MTSQMNLGIVSYLNAAPLHYSLSQRFPEAKITSDLPSRLAAKLASGSLDVAQIPSVEFLRGTVLHNYIALPRMCIASAGPVRSVKLLSHKPLNQISRLALDEGSRTSQALCRIYLDGVHGVRPKRLEELPIGVPAEESTADAILLIGDRAMNIPEDQYHTVVDLALAWRQWTGLPFVFALWVARPKDGLDLNMLTEKLLACREDGLASLNQISAIYGDRLGLPHQNVYDYLTKNLTYSLGESELAGLRLFAKKAEKLGMVPQGCEVVLHSPTDLACRN